MTDRQQPGSSHKRFVIAAAVLLGAVLALLTAVVIIAPKVINSGDVRSRIEATIAKELHGTVTIDRVELSLLPRPVVVLHGFAVDIPGTLSATIVAVRVHARLIPLFRGKFAVSSVVLERPTISLTLTDDTAGRRSRKRPKMQPTGESFDKALAVAGRELPDLSITLSRGKVSLLREGRPVLSLGNLDASLAFIPDGQGGAAADTANAEYHVTGTARATLSGPAALPAPLTVSIERFDAIPGSLTIKSARTRLQDLDASISGSFKDYLTGSPRSDILARGSIGPDALAWMQAIAGLPNNVHLRAPLTVTEARLRTTGTGSDASRTLTVNLGKKGDTTISFALRQEPGLFSIDNLHVKDGDSDAIVKFSSDPVEQAASFAGNLTGATIDRVLERSIPTPGWIKGDLQAQVPRGTWSGATVHGSLEGGQVSIPLSPEIPITLERFSLLADGNTIDLSSAALSLGQEVLQMEGSASLSMEGIDLDLDVTTEKINLSTVRKLMERKTPEQEDEKRTEPGSKPSVSGSVRLRAAAFLVDKYKADAMDMTVTFGNERTSATLEHATVCGITLTGSLRTVGGQVEATLTPQARGIQLAESIRCLFQENLGVSGSYDLSGQIGGRGSWETLPRSLEGSFAFSSSKGRFQSDHIVKGVIAYLNSTSLLKGSHDKLLKEGVPYDTFVLRGTFRDGTISLLEGVIKSRDLHIVTAGDINIRKGTLALDVLAAPFTRLDRVLGSVPIVKSLVGDALVVVPARVEGTLEHPNVHSLPVSGVGMNVKTLMKNTVQAPMKIVDPVIPKELERKDARPPE